MILCSWTLAWHTGQLTVNVSGVKEVLVLCSPMDEEGVEDEEGVGEEEGGSCEAEEVLVVVLVLMEVTVAVGVVWWCSLWEPDVAEVLLPDAPTWP